MYVSTIKNQSDIAALIYLFENNWDLSTIDELLHGLKYYTCILCFNDKDAHILPNAVIGYAFYSLDEQRNCIELTDIAVSKTALRTGVGTALIKAIKEREQKSIRLSVKTTNPAKLLYDKLGFKIIQEVDNYYAVGEDAYRMHLD